MASKLMVSIVHILFFVITSLIPYTAAAFAWDSLPTCSQPILQHYAPGTCELGLTGNDLNRTDNCLCSKRQFLDSSTVGVYIVCGCDDLSLTASQLTQNCNSTNTTAISSLDELNAIGSGGLSSCTASEFSVSTDNNQTSQNCSSSTASASNPQHSPKNDLIVATLQSLVFQKKLPQDALPWPIIRASFRHWFCYPSRKRQKPPLLATAEVSESTSPSVA